MTFCTLGYGTLDLGVFKNSTMIEYVKANIGHIMPRLQEPSRKTTLGTTKTKMPAVEEDYNIKAGPKTKHNRVQSRDDKHVHTRIINRAKTRDKNVPMGESTHVQTMDPGEDQ